QVDIYHRLLDQVSRGTLNWRVDSQAFTQLAYGEVAALKLGYGTPAPKKSFSIPEVARLADSLIDEAPNTTVAFKIPVDSSLRRFRADSKPLRQTERTHTVGNTEVDHFGLPAHLGANLGHCDAKYFGGGPSVHVLINSKGLHEVFVAAVMGKHAKFDLRIIRRHEHIPRHRYEGLTNSAALVAADRNILEVGV